MVKELEKAELALLATGNPQDQGFANIIAAVRRARGGDIEDTTPQTGPKSEARDVVVPLVKVIEAYQNQPHTPELITQTHQAIWQDRGERVGTTYEVTSCPYTQEKLTDLEANGKRVGYLPAELATQQTCLVLGKMFPEMRNYIVQKDNRVTNNEDPFGWFDYEVAIKAPYLDTKERRLLDRIKKDQRTILSLNQYIAASQDSELFTRKYLDEVGTWVRLGSHYGGRIVCAQFGGDGCLQIRWDLEAGHHDPRLGGRSSGVKKA
ncbi:hypothetical protein A2697_00440 [Candidatus Curtissbacteria bacterium RIFCSPHIGHO2_01_FULL_41_44]|nr:MAG: hypothetical protein A2697_00440 [Candidatus Curtissbacteria bacterium RIFCSPHIGHO2_01_FULL_41_44]OGE02831.1 MAG: hypothetical protein A3G16_05100 [Candidatus Curtissbacteria bacterium RIFCSPLOWO2_12_FULL_41_16]